MTAHPAHEAHDAERGDDWQLRVADRVTAWAGSMSCIWAHGVAFVLWIVCVGEVLRGDPYPFGMLTMVVSLEAIFLSTFVMIGQNRQEARNRLQAAHDHELLARIAERLDG